ncbi:MAG: hypothetical protein JOZ95_05925, partial [Solirubrobacterales bacterium]|nr:hypothetical protein [Solirubrobacterales bacterium]
SHRVVASLDRQRVLESLPARHEASNRLKQPASFDLSEDQFVARLV